MRISDELLMRIGATTVSGLGMMDLVSMEKSEDGRATAKLRFPQLILSSSIHVFRLSAESSTSGEAILRFLDVDLNLEGVADEVALKGVELTLDVGTVATAFDLETLEPAHSADLQAELTEEGSYRGILQTTPREEDRSRAGDGGGRDFGLVSRLPGSRRIQRPKGQSIRGPNSQGQQTNASRRHLLCQTSRRIFQVLQENSLRRDTWIRDLKNGHLDNLHAISRKRDCVISTKNDVLNVDIGLGLDNVLGAYHIDVKFGIFGATSDLKLKIESVELIIHALNSFREISAQKEPENVLDFDLAVNIKANLGDIDVDVNISAAIDWLVNFIAEKVVSNLKGRIQGMIKDPIRDAINSIIHGGKLF